MSCCRRPVALSVLLTAALCCWGNCPGSEAVPAVAAAVNTLLDVNVNAPVGPDFGYESITGDQCTPIQHSICQNLKYNMTTSPNWVGLSSQDESAKRMLGYQKLIDSNCSFYLRFFLCTIYFPMCTKALGKPTPLRPCRQLCEHVREKCVPFLQTFSYPWPNDLHCDNLPSQSTMCIQPDNYESDKSTPEYPDKLKKVDEKGGGGGGKFGPPDAAGAGQQPQRNSNHTAANGSPNNNNRQFPSNSVATETQAVDDPVKQCLPVQVAFQLPGQAQQCLTRCSANLLYRPNDERMAQIWLSVWSVTCAISTLLTLFTFLLDRTRFPYPERPIVYLSLCYLFYSFGILLRLAVGKGRAACRHVENPHEHILIESGQENLLCVVVFFLIHYFHQASAMWWGVLTFTWYLSAARKWGSEAVESISSGYHVLAWGLPAVQVILILLLHRVSADELTGLCVIANDTMNSLLYFHILPQLVCLLLGAVCLTLGFSSLWSVHRSLRKDVTSQANARRLEKLMAKVGIFSLLYCLPALCVLACLTYEFYHRRLWRQSLLKAYSRSETCIDPVYGMEWRQERCWATTGPWPHVEVGMLKLFMTLVVGITSGMWVWANTKSLLSWTVFTRRRILQPLCCCFHWKVVDKHHPTTMNSARVVPGCPGFLVPGSPTPVGGSAGMTHVFRPRGGRAGGGAGGGCGGGVGTGHILVNHRDPPSSHSMFPTNHLAAAPTGTGSGASCYSGLEAPPPTSMGPEACPTVPLLMGEHGWQTDVVVTTRFSTPDGKSLSCV